MILKTIFLITFLFSFSFASFQKVKIGKIDNYYAHKITLTQVENIVKEIEQTFETQLGFDVFDLSYDGKPIDILYLPASKLEKRIKRKIESFEKKSKKLDELKNHFPQKKAEIDSLQEQYNQKSNFLNQKILELNNFIENENKKSHTRQKYDEIKNYIATKTNSINAYKKRKKV